MSRFSRVSAVIGWAFAALSVPALAEVVETSADHFVTRDTATVKATPKAAWLALIEPAGWWDDDHTWSGSAANLSLVPQGGGCFCERIPEKESTADTGLAGSAQHMTVLMAEPAKVLRMRGGLGPLQSEPVDGVLTVTLQPVAGGETKLVWEYVVAGHMRYPVAKISASVDTVMSQQLAHLAGKLGLSGAEGAAKPTKPGTTPMDTASKPTEVDGALDATGSKKEK